MTEHEGKGSNPFKEFFKRVFNGKRSPEGVGKRDTDALEPGINDFYLSGLQINPREKQVSWSRMSQENKIKYSNFIALAKKLGYRGGAIVNIQTGQLQFIDSHVIAQIVSEQTHGGQDEDIKQLAERYFTITD